MSAAPEIILRRLKALGACIECSGDRLRLRAGQQPVPADLVEQARAAKPQILAVLSGRPNIPAKGWHAPERGDSEHLHPKSLEKPQISAAFIEDAQVSAFDEHLRGKQSKMLTQDAHLSIFGSSEDFCDLHGDPASKVLTSSGAGGSEHLRAATGDPSWWRAQFEERAAIRQHDRGYPYGKAELLAWREMENRWNLIHGERVSRELCAGCRRPIGTAETLDLMDGNRVHLADGYGCLIRHGDRWRAAATRALIAMGLQPPAASNAALKGVR